MNPLTIILLLKALNQSAVEQDEQRIQAAQYIQAREAGERYKQGVLARLIPRPVTHLSPAEEAANRKAEADRWLITPAELKNLRKQRVKHD